MKLYATFLLVFLALSGTLLPAQEAKENEVVPPAVEVYKGRTIAQTMHYLGAPWLIRNKREREESAEEMRRELRMKPGMVVCDFGSGNGYHTIPMAEAVGESGTVWAVDVQPEMLDMLKKRAEKNTLSNIEYVVAKYHDPMVPADTMDLILMVDVYHELSHPEPILQKIHKSLKKDGVLVLVEYRAEDETVPIKPLHKMSRDQIMKELVPNGYKLVREYDKLPWQHMMFFAKSDSELAEVPAAAAPTRVAPFEGKKSAYHGFDRFDFPLGETGLTGSVVVPKEAAPGNPWIWHGEFFGHKPAPDIALLEQGFHVAYLKAGNLLGSPKAVALWDQFYAELVDGHGLSTKPSLVGLSRGGLYVYNWAIANPDKVSSIYGDAAVCDFKSWPGATGKAKPSPGNWALVLKLWGFADEAEARAYQGNPVDNLEPLAKAGIPLLHVYGDADKVVPWDENTGVVAERYKEMGGEIVLIGKEGVDHHPHGLEDSTPIVEFIRKHAK